MFKMSPVIRISDDTFSLLQRVAKPLVDTPDSAIRNALTAYLKSLGESVGSSGNNQPATELAPPNDSSDLSSTTKFAPDSPPSLTHTSFIKGTVAGLAASNWNNLLDEAHAKAYEILGRDFDSLQRVSEARLRKGEETKQGFRQIKGLGFSIQGVDANDAWAFSLRLAKKCGFNLQAEFRWQHKDAAAFPGKNGQMSWIGSV